MKNYKEILYKYLEVDSDLFVIGNELYELQQSPMSFTLSKITLPTNLIYNITDTLTKDYTAQSVHRQSVVQYYNGICTYKSKKLTEIEEKLLLKFEES